MSVINDYGTAVKMLSGFLMIGDAEIAWTAKRLTELLAEGVSRFEAMERIVEEARSKPWAKH